MYSIVLRQQKAAPEALKGYPAWMARLLCARGVETREEAEAFLHPNREQILSPFLLPDMEKARNILWNAVQGKKKIVIYGDYDCDGVCASAILFETLQGMGAKVSCYIPDRHKEGYGLNEEAVWHLAKENDVLLTVDCGITSVQEVALAKELGLLVIVTDHHTVGDFLPPADAVVSPLLGDYPFSGLCGAGVAWKLALALDAEKAEGLMELAAIATVADMVPLLQENRAIVKIGLQMLENTKRPGLVTLMQLAGVERSVTAEQVAFQIAPRINACGRMDNARIALDMLLTKDASIGLSMAQKAHGLNEQRKQMEDAVVEDARHQVEKMDLQKHHALVVFGESWNSGVVGLAAGKLAEQWGYPAVALAKEGDTFVGSARSAGQVDIYAALKCCEKLFLRFGGHRQAAGMTLPFEHLEAFRERLSHAVKEQLGGKAPKKQFLCDGEMALADVSVESVQQLMQMEPFGMGNPSPVFVARHAEALSLRAVGREGKHLQGTFQQETAICKGIYFGGGEWQGKDGVFSLVFSPSLNTFRGETSAQLQIKYMAIEPEMLRENAAMEAVSFANAIRQEGQAKQISVKETERLMQGGQGTLLVCRCLETAKEMHRLYPNAVFALHQASDPRAYHSILLYQTAGKACAPFRHVVLCDGELLEAAAWQKACPEAEIYALPETKAVQRLAGQMWLDKDGLRNAYRALKAALPREEMAFAERTGLSLSQTYFALQVLEEIGLIEYSASPFFVSLLPMAKRDPEESRLFQMIRRLTEA